MKNLVMPKGDGTLEALNNSLSIYYENKERWVENEEFRFSIHQKFNFSGEKDGPFLIKKSEIAKYFNLVEYRPKERIAKITERGIRYFEKTSLKEKEDIIMESVLNDSFGRNNSVVPSSNSKIDPPKLLLKAIYELDYLTTKEFELMLNYMHNLNWDFKYVKDEIYRVRIGNKPRIEVKEENLNKYSDIKFRTFFLNLGIIKCDRNKYYLSDYIYAKYFNEIEQLSIYNTNKNSGEYFEIINTNDIKENGKEDNNNEDVYYGDKALNIQNNREPELVYSDSSKAKYKTNRRLSKTAIQSQRYKCTINEEHYTFIDKEDKPYMEGHHLIPMSAQKDFPNINLDRTENIVALCAICHRGIHYGNNKTRKDILYKLYKDKIEILNKVGIVIEFDDLYKKYYL